MKFEILSRREEKRAALLDRAKRYAELYKTNTTQEIAALEGVTRQRVQQILKLVGVTRVDGWRYKLTQSRTAALQAAQIEKRSTLCLALYGCDWATYKAITGLGTFYGKQWSNSNRGILSRFWDSQNKAKQSGIDWTITLPEFHAIVGDRLNKIGRGRGKLAVGRKDKNGPFNASNCVLIPHEENSRETRLQAKEERLEGHLRSVARMHAAGIPIKDIARVIGLGEGTVKLYLYRLSNKRVAA